MTFEEFCTELKKTSGWKVGGPLFVNCIRDHGNRCPLTTIAEIKTGKSYGIDEYNVAARDIGLRVAADAIARAADKIHPYSPEDRAMLLNACGLGE